MEMERKIGHLRKWTKRRRRGDEMLGGFIWTSMDLVRFYSKRSTVVEKVLCLSGILVTSQHKLNMSYGIIRLLPQFPCNLFIGHLGKPHFG